MSEGLYWYRTIGVLVCVGTKRLKIIEIFEVEVYNMQWFIVHSSYYTSHDFLCVRVIATITGE